MNFKFFESLTKEEAQEYLEEFLHFGKNRGIEILKENIHFTVDIDFCIESASRIFEELIANLKTVPEEPDETLPIWIQNTPEYEKGLFDFDKPSKSIILAAAYYLGETFVRNFGQLSWATGNTDYAEGNMPVVTGFQFCKELAPILIIENLFSRVISDGGNTNSIEVAIQAWKGFVPN
jgi:hypothetical protein